MRLGKGTMSRGGINEMDEGLVPVGGGGGGGGRSPAGAACIRTCKFGTVAARQVMLSLGKKNQLINGLDDFVNS